MSGGRDNSNQFQGSNLVPFQGAGTNGSDRLPMLLDFLSKNGNLQSIGSLFGNSGQQGFQQNTVGMSQSQLPQYGQAPVKPLSMGTSAPNPYGASMSQNQGAQMPKDTTPGYLGTNDTLESLKARLQKGKQLGMQKYQGAPNMTDNFAPRRGGIYNQNMLRPNYFSGKTF